MEDLWDLEVLEQHDWTVNDGDMVGPSLWPGGAPPRLGSALGASSPESSVASAGSGSAGGGGSVSRAEARRQVAVSRAYAEWMNEMRQYETWQAAQKRRAWMLGQSYAGRVIKRAELRELVRQEVAKDGDEAEIELWSEDDMRADYTPAELGEGG